MKTTGFLKRAVMPKTKSKVRSPKPQNGGSYTVPDPDMAEKVHPTAAEARKKAGFRPIPNHVIETRRD